MSRHTMFLFVIMTAACLGLLWAGVPPDGWRVAMPCVVENGEQRFPQACT